tara:strand:+ start:284 stop:442 length:159 start_codon:yes stop_codon:yes gene_type:complete
MGAVLVLEYDELAGTVVSILNELLDMSLLKGNILLDMSLLKENELLDMSLLK